ncbi:hypothetical protein GOODEAATRI_029189, partial [Goodea atripinnis]
ASNTDQLMENIGAIQFFRSRVQLVLLGSSLLHALLLYCTMLIRSAEYQLPKGLETSS